MLLGVVLMQVQLLVGTAPLKFGRAKNVENLAQFKTAFEFEHRISGMVGDIEKRSTALSSTISPALTQKICELWSTDQEVVFAYFDLFKIDGAHVFGQH